MLEKIMRRMDDETFILEVGSELHHDFAKLAKHIQDDIDAEAPCLTTFMLACVHGYGPLAAGGWGLMLVYLKRAAEAEEATKAWLKEHMRVLTGKLCDSEIRVFKKNPALFAKIGREIIDAHCPRFKYVLCALKDSGEIGCVMGALSTLALFVRLWGSEPPYETFSE
ncbi:MAG: hypothetical protein A3B25_00790 [Candidatus Ryanbacteria bacterium RIFCSPLOWO2_01_FULL_48_26]|uniref:Uncharacterized protein n=1 Tax=Candidatus Ryanbacteria bacterium RIFCSPLOWO2_01_FULL_48_26 TaxID=1802126 RepID=A0A1G2GS74_9BACT|nr:MAG: hypothetical protein A3B25_00790 [Candidatus Ryanbacteria bacterium RIFCSPLOWO2_01_FULL_48_26]